MTAPAADSPDRPVARLGLIGAGRTGDRWAAAVAGRGDATLAAVADHDRPRAEGLAARYGAQAMEVEELLATCDAILIATAPTSHADLAARALRAGRPALIEPPFTHDRASAVAVLALADAVGLPCLTARPADSALLAAGLGAASETPTLFETVREEPATGRAGEVSVTLDLMLDDLEHALAAFNGPAVAMRAQVLAGKPERPDAVSAVVRFRGGGEARLRASRSGPGRQRTLRAAYPSGAIQADLLARAARSSAPWSLDVDELLALEADAGLDRFIRAVAARTPPPVNARARDALDIAFHIDAICRAQPY